MNLQGQVPQGRGIYKPQNRKYIFIIKYLFHDESRKIHYDLPKSCAAQSLGNGWVICASFWELTVLRLCARGTSVHSVYRGCEAHVLLEAPGAELVHARCSGHDDQRGDLEVGGELVLRRARMGRPCPLHSLHYHPHTGV